MTPGAPFPGGSSPSSVDLLWLPLGAGPGGGLVRWSGMGYEAMVAAHHHRERRDLYHSALEVHLDGERFVIEMAPVWATRATDRGVAGEGSVGLAVLGRSRLFRYEVRRWRDGLLQDAADAVDSPRRLSTERASAQRVLDLVPEFPTMTWGRDELGAGEMWNSNSLTSWLLAMSGHETAAVHPPDHGRAPGWSAGLVAAERAPGAAATSGVVPTFRTCLEQRP